LPFTLSRPSDSEIAVRLAECSRAAFTYREVGATRGGRSELTSSVARDYDVDHHEIVLGTGRELFERARTALFAWRSFAIPWIQLHGASTPVREGNVVATLVRATGLWVLSPCRVVYVLDARDSPRCAAFAYGTLPGHPEIGEERFLIAHERETDVVRYEILAFSRAGHLFSRLGRPYVRPLQARFARSSLSALQKLE
jgi:uncharacterized protein (UPF0548 family)